MTHLDDGAALRAAMERSLHDLEQPDHLHGRVLRAGRRARRRRAALVTGALAASGLAVAGLAVLVLDGAGSPTSGIDPAAPTAQPSATSPETSWATPTPSAGPPPTGGTNERRVVPLSGNPGWWDIPSPQLAEVLEQALPAAVSLVSADVMVETGTEERLVGRGSVRGVLEGPAGPGAFQVMLTPPSLTDDAPAASELRCATAFSQCRQVRTEGSPTARFSLATDRGTTYREAVVRQPDGGLVYLYVADSTGEKPGYEAPSASAPPLDAAQLRALAEDPVWRTWTP